MSTKKILVVEDDAIAAMDIQRTLQLGGYEVVAVASSGEEAVEITEKLKPDLILMDIVLKGEMDGINASNKINEILDIPVIYLTAHSEESTVQRAKLTNPYGYLIKPFDNRELKFTVDMALYKHHLEHKLKESEKKFRLLY